MEAIVNHCLEAVATTSTKLNVLGVYLQVIEVGKANFHIRFTKYLLKSQNPFLK